MICPQDGHFTHRPSGTRLCLSGGSMGLRGFLNQAIDEFYNEVRANDPRTVNCRLSIADLRFCVGLPREYVDPRHQSTISNFQSAIWLHHEWIQSHFFSPSSVSG